MNEIQVVLALILLVIPTGIHAAPVDVLVSDEVMNEVLNPDHSIMLAKVRAVRGTAQGRFVARRLIVELKSTDRERRNLAGCALKEFGPYWTGEGAAGALRDLLAMDPEGISPCAAQAAVEVGGPLKISLREAPVLLNLKNPNYDRYVEGPLAQIGEPIVPLLIKTLSNSNLASKHLAIRILSQIGPNAVDATIPLKNLFGDRNYDTDIIAAHALLHIVPNDPDALSLLIRSLDQKRNVYWTVIELGKRKDLPEVPGANQN